MQRLLLGFAAVAAAATMSAPASAHYEVKYCYATAFYPCAVCVQEGPATACTPSPRG